MQQLDEYEFDSKILSSLNLSKIPALAGVDEAGRGPLAGPVVAAAVILPFDSRIEGLRDSKVVPVEQREALFCEIQETALAFEVTVVPHELIDCLNILEASLYAMRRSVQALSMKPDIVVVDGNKKPGSGFLEQAIIQGDGQSAAIMAASILAKVTRDHIMTEFHELYPMYGFDEHKGYSSAQHLEALQKFGPSPIHRRSFEPVRVAG